MDKLHYGEAHSQKQPLKPEIATSGTQIFSTTGKRIASLAHDESGRLYVHKSIQASKHALRTPPGLGMDTHALKQAQAKGAEYILVLDKESGNKHWTWLETMTEHGFPFNRGFGDQIGLPWAFWHNARRVPPGTRISPITEVKYEPAPKQFDLFDQGAQANAA